MVARRGCAAIDRLNNRRSINMQLGATGGLALVSISSSAMFLGEM
jgi:hypothetical protein